MSWLDENWRQVGELLQAHLFIALLATVLAALVLVSIGHSAHCFPKIDGVILSGTTLTYTIPLLPLLVAVPLVIGMSLRSPLTIIAAFGPYDMALLVRTASDALSSVDQAVIDGVTAVGRSRRTFLWTVELPLVVPMLVSGIRVVAVSTVGLVMIGALVGIPSAGMLLTDGSQRGITAEVMTGVVAAAALALAVDGLVVLLGRFFTSRTRVGEALGARGEQAWTISSRPSDGSPTRSTGGARPASARGFSST